MKAAASWKKFLRELLMESSEKIDGNMMFGANFGHCWAYAIFKRETEQSEKSESEAKRRN